MTEDRSPDDLESHPIRQLVTRDRIEINCQVTSKKRLMERISDLLVMQNSDLDARSVFQILIERERLGSTGVGNGVALPHGRVAGLAQAVGAVAVLEKPLDYDALDRQPVQLVFGLLVPEEAREQHLRILAHLAKMFDDAELRSKLLKVETVDQVLELLASVPPNRD